MRIGAAFVFLMGSCSLLFAAATACVSDNNQIGPKPGDLGGPCLSNGTYNTGLVCAVVGGSALCELPDSSAADVANDQGASDAGSDAQQDAPTSDASDAGPPCDAAITSNFTCTSGSFPLGCYDSVSSNHMCVASSNSCLNSSYTNPLIFQCFATANCQTSQPWCCLGGAPVTQLTNCPGLLSMSAGGGTNCSNTPCADAGQIPLCDLNAACPNGHPCHPVNVTTPPSLQGQVFGVCD